MKSKLGLKQRIKAYLDKCGIWVNGGKIEELSMSVGYKASNGSRRCREMAEDGLIERKEENGSVWYRTLTPKKKIDIWRTNPLGERELISTKYE